MTNQEFTLRFPTACAREWPFERPVPSGVSDGRYRHHFKGTAKISGISQTQCRDEAFTEVSVIVYPRMSKRVLVPLEYQRERVR